MNWDQLKAVLELRWQLTRNQWSRSKSGLRGAFAGIIVLAGCFLAAIAFLAGFFGGSFALRNAPASAVMLVWFLITGGFLMFWFFGLLGELQRSEAIDLQRLMHLPVRLGQIFVFNYLASHLAVSIVLALPAMVGLGIGLALVRGPRFLLLLPLAVSMILMVSAWTYCLRGWLAALMINPRRRRTILTLATMAIVALAQLPNLYFNVFGGRHALHRRGEMPFSSLLVAQKFIPPFWGSLSARSLVEGDVVPTLLATAGFLGLTAMGLRRAYSSTVRFYHGVDRAKKSGRVLAPAPSSASISTSRPSRFMERKLPGISEEASAVALASWRAMLRAPEIKMAWGMSFVVTVIVGVSIAVRSHTHLPAAAKPFLMPGLITFSLLTLTQFLSNQFGFDRDGFQTYVLSPLSRRALILGRNLAVVPIVALSSLVWLLLISVFLGLPVLTFTAALFQIATMTFLGAIAGTFISIYLPFRIRAASLKPTKISGARGLLLVVCQLLFPLLMFPVILGPLAELLLHSAEIAPTWPINLIYSVLLAGFAFLLYRLLLPGFARSFQHRETKILETLTSEVE
ncbi:MAG: hypothetical protein H0W66_10770 [Chthoniobacterales bacterium]|nr:hypothetical protein [Chthoniobacterales bacterium]